MAIRCFKCVGFSPCYAVLRDGVTARIECSIAQTETADIVTGERLLPLESACCGIEGHNMRGCGRDVIDRSVVEGKVENALVEDRLVESSSSDGCTPELPVCLNIVGIDAACDGLL